MPERQMFDVRAHVSDGVYYGAVRGYGAVFVRDSDACRLARIHWAISASRTWGEFADRVPPGVLAELLEDGERISFHEFCKEWLYQCLDWPGESAAEWFRDSIRAYRARRPAQRYPMPHERCWAADALAEGYWPGFPPRLIFEWMPRHIIETYGTTEGCVLEDDYVSFRSTDLTAILDALSEAGFACRCSPTLVNLACGNEGELSETRARHLVEAAEAATERRRRALPSAHS